MVSLIRGLLLGLLLIGPAAAQQGGPTSAPQSVVQFYSEIPFVIPGNSSMANNGVLTPGTALPTAYADAYFWMPTGWIAAASVAGWYYTTCTTTTACTVFNNTYTVNSGLTPTIPASPTSFVTTGPGNVTQTTATPIDLFNGPTIPANSLGKNGRITADAGWATSGTANNKTVTIKYSTAPITSGNLASIVTLRTLFTLVNAGKTNSQMSVASTFPGNGGSFVATNNAPGRTSIDTTLDQTIDVQITLATATDNAALQNLLITTMRLP